MSEEGVRVYDQYIKSGSRFRRICRHYRLPDGCKPHKNGQDAYYLIREDSHMRIPEAVPGFADVEHYAYR